MLFTREIYIKIYIILNILIRLLFRKEIIYFITFGNVWYFLENFSNN